MLSARELTKGRGFSIALGAVLLASLALRLVYAWAWPDGRRFWDERYSLMNVRSLYEERIFKPAKVYYPSPVVNLPPTLLVAMSESIAEKTGDSRFDAITAKKFLPATYRWVRGLQAVYGTLAIALIYFAGSHLFGRAEGYLAALLMAFMGWHIHASGVFKPDALLTMTVMAALLASVHQLQWPGWQRAITTGLMIALAASAKLTGVMIAVPLAVVALALGRRDRRYWRDLVIAGITSFGTFVAFNPYWTAYPRFIRGLRRDYDMRAGWEEMGRTQIPARTFEFITSADVLGKVLGIAALVAFALLVLRALSTGKSAMVRANAAMVVIFPVAFVVSYGLQTSYFKRNQFLVIVPFLALALAWLAVTSWRLLWQGRRTSTANLCASVFLSVLTIFAAGCGTLYVYRALVPTTLDLAKSVLSRHSRTFERIYLAEGGVSSPGNVWGLSHRRASNRVILDPVESLATAGEERLALADGWIFPSRQDSFHDSLRQRVENRSDKYFAARRFEAQLFAARGPDIEVISAWPRPLSHTTLPPPKPCGKGCVEGPLPRRRATAEALSFSILIPIHPNRIGQPDPILEVDGQPVRLFSRGYERMNRHYRSVRIPSSRKPARWVLKAKWPPQKTPVVEVSRWKLRPATRRSRQADVVGIRETIEPRQIDPGEKTEDDDQQRDDQ